jgi:hypothetical protein
VNTAPAGGLCAPFAGKVSGVLSAGVVQVNIVHC